MEDLGQRAQSAMGAGRDALHSGYDTAVGAAAKASEVVGLSDGRQGSQKFVKKTVTVVALGKSQSGKSTTINFLLQKQQTSKSSRAKMGDGGKSCTTLVGHYHIETPMYLKYDTDKGQWDQAWQTMKREQQRLVGERSGAEKREALQWPEDVDKAFQILRNNRAQISLAGKYDAKVEADQKHTLMNNDEIPVALTVEIIDTPGLDDTGGEGADDMHMANVCKALGQKNKGVANANKEVGAVMVVIKSDHNWGASFWGNYLRYWRQFPKLRLLWTIVLTNFNHTNRSHNDMDRNGNPIKISYEKKQMRRERQLKEEFKEKLDQEGDEPDLVDNLAVVFLPDISSLVNAEPDPDFDDEVPHKAWIESDLAEQQNKLLSIIANATTISIDTLTYVKSDRMKGLDSQLVAVTRGRLNGFVQGLMALDSEIGKLAEKENTLSQQALALHKAITDIDKELEEKDNDREEELGKAMRESGRRYSWKGFDWANLNNITFEYEREYNGESPGSIVPQCRVVSLLEPAVTDSFFTVNSKKVEKRFDDAGKVICRMEANVDIWVYGYVSMNMHIFCAKRDYYADTIRKLKGAKDTKEKQKQELDESVEILRQEITSKTEKKSEYEVSRFQLTRTMEFFTESSVSLDKLDGLMKWYEHVEQNPKLPEEETEKLVKVVESFFPFLQLGQHSQENCPAATCG